MNNLVVGSYLHDLFIASFYGCFVLLYTCELSGKMKVSERERHFKLKAVCIKYLAFGNDA